MKTAKKIFSSLLLVLAMLFVCALSVGAEETKAMSEISKDAPAVAGDVITISTEAELVAFSKYVSDGGLTEGVTFRLDADIALTTYRSGKSWATNLSPIGGMYDGAAEVVAFKGVFDGNGKTISNLQINNKAGSSTLADAKAVNVGLFALLDGATVKDLTVQVTKINAVGKDGAVGVIAAQAINDTVISGCIVEADMSATGTYIQNLRAGATFGGIVGKATNTVIDGCTANLKVKGQSVTGGIVGIATDSVVRNSVAGGTYEHNVVSFLGGIVGELAGSASVENCYSVATLKSTITSDVVGGVAAKVGAEASVENCFSAATVSATDAQATFGVLVGVNDGTVAYAYALRDESAGGRVFLTAHSVIGEDNGTSTEVYAYQPKTEDGVTVFVVGTVERTENTPCHTVAGSECEEDYQNSACSLCGGDGILQTMYSFVPASSEGGSLVDALNDWVSDKAGSDVTYTSWIIVGDFITNCSHGAVVYKNVSLKATCIATGIGDKHCAVCDTLLEAGVTIPVDTTNGHQGKEYACLAYYCTLCGEHFDATIKHEIGNKHCIDQACVKCGTVVEATEAHKNLDPNEDMPCAEYECFVCGETTHDHDHDFIEAEYACEDVFCTVCGYAAQIGAGHRPGRSASCTRDQVCLKCGIVLMPKKGHVPGKPSTCSTPQTCLECSAVLVPAGYDAEGNVIEHAWNREAATCVQAKICIDCGAVGEEKKEHLPNFAQEVNCGQGRACLHCGQILESAVGEHTVDWSMATVVRAATAERTGIIVGSCSVCGREVEIYPSLVIDEETGKSVWVSGNLVFSITATGDVLFENNADNGSHENVGGGFENVENNGNVGSGLTSADGVIGKVPAGTIYVDGVKDAAYASGAYLPHNSQMTSNGAYTVTELNPSTNKLGEYADPDIAADTWMLWDGDYIYLLIEVYDKSFTFRSEAYVASGVNAWFNDAIELWYCFEQNSNLKSNQTRIGLSALGDLDLNGNGVIDANEKGNGKYALPRHNYKGSITGIMGGRSTHFDDISCAVRNAYFDTGSDLDLDGLNAPSYIVELKIPAWTEGSADMTYAFDEDGKPLTGDALVDFQTTGLIPGRTPNDDIENYAFTSGTKLRAGNVVRFNLQINDLRIAWYDMADTSKYLDNPCVDDVKNIWGIDITEDQLNANTMLYELVNGRIQAANTYGLFCSTASTQQNLDYYLAFFLNDTSESVTQVWSLGRDRISRNKPIMYKDADRQWRYDRTVDAINDFECPPSEEPEVNYYEFSYTVQGSEATITGFSKNFVGALVIPSTIDGYRVTGIGEEAFKGCNKLTSVVIPEGVKSIGAYAFYRCQNLTSIVIPDTVISIDSSAFYDTKCLVFEDGAAYIGNHLIRANVYGNYKVKEGTVSIASYAFLGASINSITLPEGLVAIGAHAFEGCGSLLTVTIPNSVTYIGENAFRACSLLRSITLPFVGNAKNEKANGHFGYIFGAPSFLDQNSYIPRSLKQVVVTGDSEIGSCAFQDCTGLITFTLSDSIRSIGFNAFRNTGYYNEESNWEDGVLYIGKHLIVARETLNASYTVKEGTVSIAENAFSDCEGLVSVQIPSSVTSVSAYAFAGCKSLDSISLPENGLRIGYAAFYGTAYYNASANWENDVLYLGKYLIAAKETLSGSYTVKAGTLGVAGGAFYDCSLLTSIVLPDTVSSIGTHAFSGCARLTEMELPWGVTEISDFAFSGAGALTSITIPDTVSLIGKNAFLGNTSLKTVYSYGNVTSWDKIEGGQYLPKDVSFVSLKSYTFYDEDGVTVLKRGTSSLSGALIIPPDPPTKPATEQYTYTFIGWEGYTEGMVLTENVSFVAKYLATLNKCTYTFFDEDGVTVLATATVNYGTIITSPADPQKPATQQYTYTFRGFDGFTSGMALTEDVTFIAKYDATVNKYTYTFFDEDGVTVLGTATVDYGTTITAPVDPVKPATQQYSYPFAGFDGFASGMVLTDNVTFVAKYDTVVNKYTYTFYDEDGVTVLKQATVDYGTAIPVPADPQKPATQQYTYTFIGFDGFAADMLLTEDITFIAKYDATVNKYTYIFFDEDGVTLLGTATVDYGTTIIAPADPQKPATQQYTYTFRGFDGFAADMLLTEDITFIAKYDATVNKYTYTFLDEDGVTILGTATVDYGTTITAPVDPTKPATQQYTYTFRGFDGFTSGMELTEDVTFIAKYDATVNKYTYTFFDEDGVTVLGSATVDYGTIITAPADPQKPATQQYSYPFAGFDGFTSGMTLTDNVTFVAKYDTVVNKYTYTFYDEDGVTVLKQETVDYGTVIVAPHVDTIVDKANTYTPYFMRFNEGAELTKNVSYTLAYVTTINKYTYTFFDEDGETVLYTATLDYGTRIEAPKDPVKPATQQYTYTFAGFDGFTANMLLTEDITFTAKYDATVNKYTYTFFDEDGVSVLYTATLDYGTAIAVPQEPTKENDTLYAYTFAAWLGYTEGAILTEDISFTASYMACLRFAVGDVNMDGAINALDALLIKQHLVEMITLSEDQLVLADTCADDEINALDAMYVEQYIVEMRDTLGNLVNVTFVTETEEKCCTVTVGDAVEIIPEAPADYVWSESAEEYVAPDFTAIVAEKKYYLVKEEG